MIAVDTRKRSQSSIVDLFCVASICSDFRCSQKYAFPMVHGPKRLTES